jgi:hypothetical protein
MTGHTGYLVFARNVEPDAWPEPGRRRRGRHRPDEEEQE